MPHRKQELLALCRECREPAAASCLRCSAPLCDNHEPADDVRCIGCEEVFSSKTKRLRAAALGELQANMGKTSVGIIGTLITAAFAINLAVPPLPLGLFGVLIAAAVAVGFGTWWVKTPPRSLTAKRRLRRLRGKFLKKRGPKRLGRGDSSAGAG